MTRIGYDAESDCLYIQHSDNEVHRTVVVSFNTMVDVDAEGRVVGAEILFASKSGVDIHALTRATEAVAEVEERVKRDAPDLVWASA